MKTQTIQSWLVATLLLMTCNLFAQAPGYLGKRNIFNYDLLFAPQLSYYGKDFSYNPEQIVPLNLKHVLSYDRVISRSFTLGVEAGLRFTGYHDKNFHISNGSEQQIAKVIAPTVGVHGRIHTFHSRGTIAPLGTYFEFIVRMGYGKGVLTTIPERTVGRMGEFIMPCLGVGIGKNVMIGESIIFDLGLQLVACAAFENGLTRQEPISDQIGFAMSTEEIFNFKIGIGFLSGKLKH